MANSLISPITIDGTAYCCKCYGTSAALGRGTKGIKTDSSFGINGATNNATITDDCSPWELLDSGNTGSTSFEGEITFGVSCGTTVEIDLTVGSHPQTAWEAHVYIYIDGVLDTTAGPFSYFDAIFFEAVTLTVTGGPCGSLVTLHAVATDTSAVAIGLEAEVTSIT